MLHTPLRIAWEPLPSGEASDRSAARLGRILRSWEGTPYAAGGGYRGVAADCVRSTVLILSEWVRARVPHIETLPPDASLHSRWGAIRGLIRIRRALPEHVRLRHPTAVQPGDVLITGHPAGGPGHSIIVGTERNTLWQATQSAGFVRCGWGLPADYARLYAVLRFCDRKASE